MFNNIKQDLDLKCGLNLTIGEKKINKMGLSRNIGSAVRTRLLKGRSESIVITKIRVTLLQNKMEMNWVAVWGKHVNVMKMLYLQI